MRLDSIKVRGAIGFKKGLGLDEVEVDFSGLSGLIALSGPNGRGKTTLLEALSPYRTFASRKGSLRHHFFLRDSYIDRSFYFDGNLYRTLVKIDSDSDRGEAFIWKNGEPEIDGKNTQYDDYIKNLFGSQELFYNSVFCSQGARKLSDLRTGELKELFVEFLRLDRLSAYEDAAKRRNVVVDGKIETAKKNLETANESLRDFENDEDNLNILIETDQLNQAQIKEAELKETELMASVDDVKKIIATNDVNISRVADIEKNIAHITADIDEDEARYVVNRNALLKAMSAKTIEIDDLKNILKKRDEIAAAADELKVVAKNIGTERGEADILEEEKNNIECDLKKLREIGKSLNSDLNGIDDSKITEITNELESHREAKEALNKSYREIEASIKSVSSSPLLNEKKIQISIAEEKLKILENIDPACDSKICGLIVSAREAEKCLPGFRKEFDSEQKRIAEEKTKLNVLANEIITAGLSVEESIQNCLGKIEKERVKINKSKSDIEEKIKHLESSIRFHEKGVDEKKDAIAQTKGKIAAFEERLSDLRLLAEKKFEIESAESKIIDLSKQKLELWQRTVDDEEQKNNSVKAKNDRIYGLKSDIKRLESEIQPNAGEKLMELNQSLEDVRVLIEKLRAKDTETKKSIAILEKSLEKKAETEEKIKSLKAEIGILNKEHSEWDYLKLGCGKKGLQALEISGAAPLINGYANELLNSSFGPSFSARLITQDELTGKEVLDILVTRSDGSESNFKLLSGGEKVWILKALGLAMTLVSKHKSGRNYESLFADEEDGALDIEKALSFIGLYRSILDTGGFYSCLFISHKPEIVAMADHEIRFEEDGIYF